MGPLEIVAALGAVVALVIAVMTLLEKVTGAGQRWVARAVEDGNRPIAALLEVTRAEVNDVKADLKEHRNYTKYHLGPNGDSPRLHDRVERIERRIDAVSYEQDRIRRDQEDDHG